MWLYSQKTYLINLRFTFKSFFSNSREISEVDKNVNEPPYQPISITKLQTLYYKKVKEAYSHPGSAIKFIQIDFDYFFIFAFLLFRYYLVYHAVQAELTSTLSNCIRTIPHRHMH